MKNIILLNFAAIFALFLVSCGTTSGLKPTANNQDSLSAIKYENVLVQDFTVASSIKPQFKYQADSASKSFPDMIAGELKALGQFKSVGRTKSANTSADTMVITGEITQYDDGNAALRLMIGFGAGSSRFDSNVEFSGGSPSKKIGSVTVDKNSWVLGGGLAATQTAASYMPGAAKKIAKEASSLAR